MQHNSEEFCPCQSGQPYTDCCGLYHETALKVPNALALMRSRYTAFGLGKVDYLISTTHRDNLEYNANIKQWRKGLAEHCSRLKLVGLEILDYEPGEPVAYVSFDASILADGQPVRIREKSRFMKLGERWLYHSGVPI